MENYSWIHGYVLANNHTSATCCNKAEGQQDAVACNNTMGGSKCNKPKAPERMGHLVAYP